MKVRACVILSALGLGLFVGTAMADDLQKLRSLAQRGSAMGEDVLGDCYYYGDGVPRDYTMAVYWYQKAANQGNVPAEYGLGAAYFFGEGVPQDFAQAYMWLDIAKGSSTQHDSWYVMAGEMMSRLSLRMTPEQIARAQAAASAWFAAHNRS